LIHTTTTSTPLYYQRSCPHRYLHPFPTRRSSDLAWKPETPDSNPGSSTRFGAGDPRTMLTVASAVELLPARSIAVPLIGTAIDLDRKSTRLNSSHVSISYAVFCLKKKKIIYFLQT